MSLLLIASGVLTTTSCDSGEIDINAPFVERPIVWGLLDASDTLHYFRIQRTFLAEENANTSAADPDKIHYPAGVLEVKLEELLDSNVNRSWLATRVDGNLIDREKNDGLFATDPNVLYEFDAILNQELEYRLTIRHLETDSVYSGTTALVGSFDSFFPIQPDFAIDFADTGKFKVQWLSAEGGFLYDAWYEMSYAEWTPGQMDTTFENVGFPMFRNFTFPAGAPFNILETNITNRGFYTGIRGALDSPEGGRVRDYRGLRIDFGAGGQDLYLLYLNSIANLGILELFISPAYSNISGDALGIISARSTDRSAPVLLTPVTIDSLACGRITSHLGFLRADDSSCP